MSTVNLVNEENSAESGPPFLTVCSGLHGNQTPSRHKYILLSFIVCMIVLLSFVSTGFWYINHKGNDHPFRIYLLTEDNEPILAKIMKPSEAKQFINENNLPKMEASSSSVKMTSTSVKTPSSSIDMTSSSVKTSSSVVTQNPTCSNIPETEKFDCYPEPSVTEEKCLSRGCCYQQLSQLQNEKRISSNFPIPHCYFPSNYVGYTVESKITDQKLTAELNRKRPSGFPKDISKLKLDVTNIDENIVRIKIIDPTTERFEPPIIQNIKTKNEKSQNYNITCTNGILSIIRKTNRATLFSANLQQMIYSEQFLQVSTKLSTPNLYGLGERYEPFLKDINWTKRALFNHDSYPLEYTNLYGTHAIYVAIEKDGKSHGVFLLNSNALEIILQPTPALTYRALGGILDFFVFLGPNPSQVVEQYTSIIGRPFMPPYWSLGFHLCRWGYFNLNNTVEVWNRTRYEEIPFDTQWHDIDYMDRFNDFTYDKVNFSRLPEFVDEIHKKNMHYVVILDPGVSGSEKNGTYEPYDDGIRANLFIKNNTGGVFVAKVWNKISTVFPDFSHSATNEYWYTQLKNLHDEISFDGAWIDMNEPANMYSGTKDGCPSSSLDNPPYVPSEIGFMNNHTLCMSARHANSSHYNEHNLHAFREAMATSNALRKILNKRPFIISRATFAGQGYYSGHWSGDIASTWEDMRYSNIALLNFNIFGIPMMGSDICGFRLNTTEELCARWQAVGAFYPFSRNHNSINQKDQDPVILGDVVMNVTKNTLITRYTLLPYLYTLFYKSHAYGKMVVTSLAFEFPTDPKVYATEDQFLWGSALLIIPALYENMVEVKVYLPKTIWYDYYTGKKLLEGQENILPAPLYSINLAIRGGYIIPQQHPAVTTVDSRKNNFTLLIALDENNNAQGELYWDDGDSLDTYEKELYNLIKFKVENNSLTSDIVQSKYSTIMELDAIKIYGVVPKPKEVTTDGNNATFTYDEYSSLHIHFESPISLLKSFKVEWK